MEEIYKDIEGYEGLYEISNLGNVKSLVNHKGVEREKILKPLKNRNGYKGVHLYKNKTSKTYDVHRLVANAFLPNPHNLPCVNHKDECRTNNNVENLEWCSYKYNTNFGTGNSRRSKAMTNNQKRSKAVGAFKEGELIMTFPSTNEAGRQGFNQGNVWACCRNCYLREGNNIYRGFEWRYL